MSDNILTQLYGGFNNHNPSNDKLSDAQGQKDRMEGNVICYEIQDGDIVLDEDGEPKRRAIKHEDVSEIVKNRKNPLSRGRSTGAEVTINVEPE